MSRYTRSKLNSRNLAQLDAASSASRSSSRSYDRQSALESNVSPQGTRYPNVLYEDARSSSERYTRGPGSIASRTSALRPEDSYSMAPSRAPSVGSQRSQYQPSLTRHLAPPSSFRTPSSRVSSASRASGASAQSQQSEYRYRSGRDDCPAPPGCFRAPAVRYIPGETSGRPYDIEERAPGQYARFRDDHDAPSDWRPADLGDPVQPFGYRNRGDDYGSQASRASGRSRMVSNYEGDPYEDDRRSIYDGGSRMSQGSRSSGRSGTTRGSRY